MANSNQAGPTKALYLDDLHVGQRFTSNTHLIDEEQIKGFAKQFDPQPFHLDAEAAKGYAHRWRCHWGRRRNRLAKADAAGRCPPCRERNPRTETVALSSRPRHG